jgi:drug/metabolite transporter (DMT)-like permease
LATSTTAFTQLETSLMLDRYLWLVYVGLAGLSWGTYVPLIFYGGSELTPKPGDIGGRIMAILCVGIAYFVIAVVVPLALFFSGSYSWPPLKGTGVVFSSLAGVAGAIGALCVIFATQNAVSSARASGLNPAAYKMYIAPLIFGLAPLINTVVSMFWHPRGNEWFSFGLPEEMPGWKLWVGILLVGAGAALVLFSKEEAEVPHPPKAPQAAMSAAPPAAGIPETPR